MRRALPPLLLAALAGACLQQIEPFVPDAGPADSGADAGPTSDGGVDAGADSGASDAGGDGGADAGVDGGADAGPAWQLIYTGANSGPTPCAMATNAGVTLMLDRAGNLFTVTPTSATPAATPLFSPLSAAVFRCALLPSGGGFLAAGGDRVATCTSGCSSPLSWKIELFDTGRVFQTACAGNGLTWAFSEDGTTGYAHYRRPDGGWVQLEPRIHALLGVTSCAVSNVGVTYVGLNAASVESIDSPDGGSRSEQIDAGGFGAFTGVETMLGFGSVVYAGGHRDDGVKFRNPSIYRHTLAEGWTTVYTGPQLTATGNFRALAVAGAGVLGGANGPIAFPIVGNAGGEFAPLERNVPSDVNVYALGVDGAGNWYAAGVCTATGSPCVWRKSP